MPELVSFLTFVLFIWGFTSLLRRIFHSFGDITWPVKGCDFLTIYSALMALSNEGFLSSPQLLRHVPTVYDGYLKESVTLTSVAKRLVLKRSLPVLMTDVCPDRLSNPISCMPSEHCTTYSPLRLFSFVQSNCDRDDLSNLNWIVVPYKHKKFFVFDWISSHSRIFRSYGDSIVWLLRPSSNECSLAA